MFRSKRYVIPAVVGLAAAIGANPSNAGFYDDKDVTVIINAGAGGGLTRSGRLFTTTMKKYLGNGTNMIVKNVADPAV